MDGRRGEHLPDVIKSVSDVVGWKVISRMQVQAIQIADRVVVLVAIGAADRDSVWSFAIIE
jgi:hypothetical protein